MEDGREVGRLPRHVGDGGRPVEDRSAAALDRHVDLRVRDVHLPREHRSWPDRAASVVDLRLRQEERVLSLDAPRAHVVAARERDDLTVRVREDGELGLGYVPCRVLAHADLAAVRNDAPSRRFEEELRPVALVDLLVDRLLGRLLNARLAASQVGDARGPDLLRLGGRRDLDLSEIQLRAGDRAETSPDPVERQPKKRVERERVEIPKPRVAPEGNKGPAFAADAHERRGRDVERFHFPPRTPPSTKRPVPITKLDSSDARKSAADATSSGFPSSAVSWRLRIAVRPSSRFGYDSRRYFSTNGVWIVPGRSAFTRMPNRA